MNEPPPIPLPAMPNTVIFFKAYCAVLTVVILLFALYGWLWISGLEGPMYKMSTGGGDITSDLTPKERGEKWNFALSVAVSGPILAVAHIVGIFLPRKPWSYFFTIALMAFGITCCMISHFNILFIVLFASQASIKNYYFNPHISDS